MPKKGRPIVESAIHPLEIASIHPRQPARAAVEGRWALLAGPPVMALPIGFGCQAVGLPPLVSAVLAGGCLVGGYLLWALVSLQHILLVRVQAGQRRRDRRQLYRMRDAGRRDAVLAAEILQRMTTAGWAEDPPTSR